MKEHLYALWQVINIDDVDVRGYFVWSLLDNFEWSFGTSKRFGLAYTDYASQSRFIKDSGLWYARTIAENGFDIVDKPGALILPPGVRK